MKYKKILFLVGSPHKNGCTAALISCFAQTAAQNSSDVEFDYFYAYETPVFPCNDCGMCIDANICPMDDFLPLHEQLMACDMIVIATAVYHLSFPAPLKAVFDRMQQYHNASIRGNNPLAQKKRGAVLLLSAGSPSERGEVIRSQMRWILPTLNAELLGCVVCADTDRSGLNAQAIKETALLTTKLITEE